MRYINLRFTLLYFTVVSSLLSNLLCATLYNTYRNFSKQQSRAIARKTRDAECYLYPPLFHLEFRYDSL